VVEAQKDGPPRPHRLDRAERKLREQTASTNDDLIGVVGMPLVADAIEPSDVHAIACALRPARPRAGAALVQSVRSTAILQVSDGGVR